MPINIWSTAYERDVIRAHALGKFKDLLVATAQSPAMLFYLDNWLSMGPKSPAAVAANKGKPGQAVPGLNENYGRELMELAHPQRQWRLHAARRDRTGARANRMDHSAARAGRGISV